jgi:hypothetical protein
VLDLHNAIAFGPEKAQEGSRYHGQAFAFVMPYVPLPGDGKAFCVKNGESPVFAFQRQGVTGQPGNAQVGIDCLLNRFVTTQFNADF